MFISRSTLVSIIVISSLWSSPARAAEPHLLRNNHQENHHQADEENNNKNDSSSMDSDSSKIKPPKMDFSIEKGIRCNGGNDPSTPGAAGKKCEGGLKKKFSISANTENIVSDTSKEMNGMFHSMMSDDDRFIPVEDTMMELIEMDDIDFDHDSMEVASSRTVGYGGFFKAVWECNVTYSKDGFLKLSKTVQCGAKTMEAMGKIDEEEFFGDDAEINAAEDNEF
jgi:hypothetical protein